jgi:hypothetical protein
MIITVQKILMLPMNKKERTRRSKKEIKKAMEISFLSA